MKPDFTLINDYLRRYYEGNTTPAENAMLLSMLEVADDSELTPELRMEREILRAVCDSGMELQSESDVAAKACLRNSVPPHSCGRRSGPRAWHLMAVFQLAD